MVFPQSQMVKEKLYEAFFFPSYYGHRNTCQDSKGVHVLLAKSTPRISTVLPVLNK